MTFGAACYYCRCCRARERISLFTGGIEGGDGIPPEQLERALAIVRRRMDNPSHVDFLEEEGEGGDNVPALRKQVHQLRQALLSSQQQCERTEEMLRVQKAICTNLEGEVSRCVGKCEW